MMTRRDAARAFRGYLDARRIYVRAVVETCGWTVGVKSPRWDGMPHARGGHKDLSDIIVSQEADEEKVRDARAAVEAAREAVESLIRQAELTDWETEVIRCRYLDALGTHCSSPTPWGVIADFMGVTYAAVTHAHDRALSKAIPVLETRATA